MTEIAAVEEMESAACERTAEEIDFVDWVFNAAPVLKEQTAWMALNEGLSYAWDPELRAPYEQKLMVFVERITDTLSKKMVRKVKNRWEMKSGRGTGKGSSGLQTGSHTDSGKGICFSQDLTRRILGRKFGLALNWPMDANSRVAPQQAALVLGVPVVCRLVE